MNNNGKGATAEVVAEIEAGQKENAGQYLGELQEKIEQGLRMLARYRLQNDDARDGLIGLIKQLEATAEYQHWSQAKAQAERECAQAEKLVRKDVLAYLEASGEKPKVKAIGTRTRTTLLYEDKMALAWCQLFFEDALALNRELFEKHAKAVAETNPVPFVELKKEVFPTIATDLGEYLVEPDGFPK